MGGQTGQRSQAICLLGVYVRSASEALIVGASITCTPVSSLIPAQIGHFMHPRKAFTSRKAQVSRRFTRSPTRSRMRFRPLLGCSEATHLITLVTIQTMSFPLASTTGLVSLLQRQLKFFTCLPIPRGTPDLYNRIMVNHAHQEGLRKATAEAASLQAYGWVAYRNVADCESEFRQKLFNFASLHGRPVGTRAGGNLLETLLPTNSATAKPRSLSKIHGFGEFPLHVDTAHWLTPCRYVVLGCASTGTARRPTLLLDTRRLPLSKTQLSLLHSTPFRITNGRNSFFSTILSKSRPFVRYDPGCMTPTTPEGAKVLEILARDPWAACIETVSWEPAMLVLIDNWRVLHGRPQANCYDPDRKLLRISIQ
jgi:hypothetical protein